MVRPWSDPLASPLADYDEALRQAIRRFQESHGDATADAVFAQIPVNVERTRPSAWRRLLNWFGRDHFVKVGWFGFGCSLWAINRPRFSADWYDKETVGASLSWGNGNSDPVWHADVEFIVPKVILRWFDRRSR